MMNCRTIKVYLIFPNFLPRSATSRLKGIHKSPWKLDEKTEQGWKEKGNLPGKVQNKLSRSD